MRVALSFPACHRRGGVERVILESANFLQRRGHEVHVFTSRWDEQLLEPGITCHRVRTAGRPAPLSVLTFAHQSRRELRQMRPCPDVLGSFGVQSPPGGVLWVQSVHKAWLEASRARRPLSGRLRQRLNPFHPVILALEHYQFAGRRYRKLIALTEQVKADLSRLYGVPDSDVEVIANGFAPAEFNLDRAQQLRDGVRRRLGFAEGERVVVFAANEFERKGFGPLLDATASLNDRSVHLLAVGRLNPTAYAGTIDRMGLSDRVKFTGPTDDVAQYYAAADLFALPTQYEAWGLVIVEAMACGLPVVTSRLAGAAIAVTEGQSGYLLDDPQSVQEIAEKLRLLLGGQHADRQWIAASVAPFSWPNVLPVYERVLEACIQKDPRGSELVRCA